MCETSYYCSLLPPAQFLQFVQRRAILHMSTGPSMTQVMLSKIIDSSTLQRSFEAAVLTYTIASPFRANTYDGCRPVCTAKTLIGIVVDRNGNCSMALRLVWVHPSHAPRHINLPPL